MKAQKAEIGRSKRSWMWLWLLFRVHVDRVPKSPHQNGNMLGTVLGIVGILSFSFTQHENVCFRLLFVSSPQSFKCESLCVSPGSILIYWNNEKTHLFMIFMIYIHINSYMFILFNG